MIKGKTNIQAKVAVEVQDELARFERKKYVARALRRCEYATHVKRIFFHK